MLFTDSSLQVPWISPTYQSATVSTRSGDTIVTVTVTLGNATALKAATPHNIGPCSRQMRCVPGQHPEPHGRAGIGCIPANTSAGWAGYPENVGGDCGWAAIQSRDGGWANATVSITGSGRGTQLVLEAAAAVVKGEVVATSYGWGVYAMISTYTVAQVAGTLAGSDTAVGGIPVCPGTGRFSIIINRSFFFFFFCLLARHRATGVRPSTVLRIELE